MLPKSQRLPHSLRLGNSRSFRTEFFLVKTISNTLAAPRFGVVISKKVDKRAVRRNRMRRLLHQAAQTQFSQITKGQDILFIVQKPFDELSEKTIQDITSFLQKV